MRLLSFRKQLEQHVPDELIGVYLADKSYNTKRQYACVYLAWINYLTSKDKNIFNATPKEALGFIHQQLNRKGQVCRDDPLDILAAKSTVRHKIIILNTLYNFLRVIGEIDIHNPFSQLLVQYRHATTGTKRPTEIVPFNKIQELINKPRDWTVDGRRDRALLHTLAASGMRIGECLGLKICDINETDDGTLFAYLHKTKSGKPQRRAFAPFAVPILKEFIRDRLEQDGATKTDYVFTSYRGVTRQATQKCISVSTAQRIVQGYAYDCHLQNISPHSFRATVATKLLSENCNYREVQEVLGHSSIRMTERYDKRRIEIEQSAVKKLSF